MLVGMWVNLFNYAFSLNWPMERPVVISFLVCFKNNEKHSRDAMDSCRSWLTWKAARHILKEVYHCFYSQIVAS